MNHRLRVWLTVALLLSAALFLPSWAEEELLLEEAAGILPLEGESRLRIEGAFSRVRVRPGKEGELRFLSTPTDDPKESLNIPLWTDGTWLIFRPEAAVSEDPDAVPEPFGSLEVAVPMDMLVALDVYGGEVNVSGLRDDLEVEAVDAEVVASNLHGPASFVLTGGSFNGHHFKQALDLDGADVSGKLQDITGETLLALAGGAMELVRVRALTGSVEEGGLKLEGVAGRLELDADSSRVEISDLAEGELRLSRTPLSLTGGKGAISIDSDGEVILDQADGEVRVTGFGADVTVSGGEGSIFLEVEGGSVELSATTGPIEVNGAGLVVEANHTAGDLTMQLSDSEIQVAEASGALTLANEFGPIEVSRSRGKVDITNREGDVSVLGSSTAIQLDVEGGDIDLSWEILSGKEDSIVNSSGGDVSLTLPTKGGCRLELSADGGVQSEHPQVQVQGNSNNVNATLNRFSRPSLRVTSDGVVYVYGGEGP